MAAGIIWEADVVNAGRWQRVIDLSCDLLGTDLRGKWITTWGAVFNLDTGDIRDSPALAVA